MAVAPFFVEKSPLVLQLNCLHLARAVWTVACNANLQFPQLFSRTPTCQYAIFEDVVSSTAKVPTLRRSFSYVLAKSFLHRTPHRCVGDGKHILMTSALVLQLLQCPLADVECPDRLVGTLLPASIASFAAGARGQTRFRIRERRADRQDICPHRL